MIKILENLENYDLLDSGDGEKLERFGKFVLRRPDPQILWQKRLPESVWKKADGHFKRIDKTFKWVFKNEKIEKWTVKIYDLILSLRLNNFKHTGFFPEQTLNFGFMEDCISEALLENNTRQIRALNLFGYTGVSSLFLSKLGVSVTHIDASKQAIMLGNESKENSGLKNSGAKFFIDDAFRFVEREIKRGVRYDCVIMDPPVYGTFEKTKWKIERDLTGLLFSVKKIISNKPIFFLISGYASEYSSLTYQNLLVDLFSEFKNIKIESGELSIKEKDSERLLSAGIFARAYFK